MGTSTAACVRVAVAISLRPSRPHLILNELSLRTLLRSHTSDIHSHLDETVGAWPDLAAYRAYLAATHGFRAAVEPVLASFDWEPQPLAAIVARDLEDLSHGHAAALPRPRRWATPSARLGVLYVLEGSAVGARLLLRRAGELGLTADHGARHLACQNGDAGRWQRFVRLLDSAQDVDRGEATAAARDAFRLAVSFYGSRTESGHV